MQINSLPVAARPPRRIAVDKLAEVMVSARTAQRRKQAKINLFCLPAPLQ